MKPKALVTGGTKKDTAAMACLLLNLKKTNPHLVDEVIIYHDGIRIKDQLLMRKIFPTRFIRYISPFETEKKFDKGTIEYFSLMVFCKYECLKLLSEYSTVIWSDYDVLITDDLSELTDFSHSEAIKLIQYKNILFKDQFLSDIELPNNFQYDFLKPCIGLPLFVFSDSLHDTDRMYSLCIQNTVEYGKIFCLPEQAGFQMMIQQLNIQYTSLEANVYVCHPKEIDQMPENKILHAHGQPKFWNGLHNETWEKYYAEWRSMGGCKHLNRYTNTDRFFRRIHLKIQKLLKRGENI